MSDDRFSFATGTNITYIEGLYQDYRRDPTSVDETWRRFFEGYEFAASMPSAPGASGSSDGQHDEAKVEAFINAYRRLGYLSADLDPIHPRSGVRDELKPENHGLAHVAGDQQFSPANLPFEGPATFDQIHSLVQKTYCHKIGVDYRDVNDVEAVVWLQSQMEEVQNRPVLNPEQKLRILDKLTYTEGFERFIQDRYLGQKRFSIEGLDSMIPLLDWVANDASDSGVEEINIGMAHRGRLNVLANFMNKDYEQLITEFEGAEFNPLTIEGDVKYHKGFAGEVPTLSGKPIRLFLTPNPSHLEVVNPVLEGFARARQRLLDDSERGRVMPILIHGDAAFSGQGVVAETLNLSELDAYKTGGTIHIIANNLIGFTANPDESKSCAYASDMAKFIRAPVFHVNADDPEAVVWAARLAVRYRQKYKTDVVIDLIGYRRHGHNETDEPGFTQPLLYKLVKAHPTVLTLYQQQLAAEGVLTLEESKGRLKEFRSQLQEKLVLVRDGKYESKHETPAALQESLQYIPTDYDDIWTPVETKISPEQLDKLSTRILSFPEGFTPHPKIVKLFGTRKEMFAGEGAIDWGMAELLAYGASALDGYHVRLTGQDSRRGTFSHRHVVLRDFENDSVLGVLDNLDPTQAPVDVINSPLSEAGCLGFEFGYSVADTFAMVLWEAQFGDFANGAQIIMDQFLVASEAKWKQACSLVLLLPHGYEGQGPEHSSARLERFLQMCGNLNIQVANLTTAAQIFHILRRQVVRKFQKPLVIMTPKSLLRHPGVASPMKAFTEGSFEEVLTDQSITEPESVKKIIMCSGKVYYDLLEAREKNGGDAANIPLVRLEQFYPFPNDKLEKVISSFPNAKEIVWTQEEPVNMGGWSFVRSRLETLANGKEVTYVGRKGSGSTAEGSLKSHITEQQRIVQDALGLAAAINPKGKAIAH